MVTSRKRRMALVFVCLALLAGEPSGKAEGAFGYIDREGNPVIPCQFSYAYEFYSGRARVFSGTLKIRESGCFRRGASGTLWIWQGMKSSPARKCTGVAPIAF